jgi:2-oxoglutarate dehydrogenase E2 component (dihydrolipoamide succinyltransferase)
MGESFEKTHGIKLGFMSFFAKAAANALQRTRWSTPRSTAATSSITATPTSRSPCRPTRAWSRRCCATSSDGLRRRREGHRRLRQEGARRQAGLEDLQGGTFTITNGGTFGSLMSTPIVNPPQSAILGMHAIKDRPIAENGQVVIAPMMYIALSYDHRIIDGKDAVLFLVDIKNQLENPHRMLLGL